LNPIEAVPISSYVVRIALLSNPAEYIDQIEIPADENPLQTVFDGLTDGETYQVTAISKFGSFASQVATIGNITLSKYAIIALFKILRFYMRDYL